MKFFKILIFLVLSIIIFWVIFTFITFPNMEKIENKFKSEYSQNITPDKSNYDSLVKNDLKINRTILIGKAKSSKMYDNSLPFLNNNFEPKETERIIRILNDSTNYKWGEIGTPYYDKIIVFFDGNKNEIGYVNISFDGEIEVFPNIALTKWGLLSDKGFKELLVAIRTE